MGILEELAWKKFRELSEAEKRVLQAAPNGSLADCTDLGGGDEPEKADGTPQAPDERWPETRNVRADLIRWLCVDREAREQVDPKGVWIQGARIAERLDLSSTNVLFLILLLNCRLERDLKLSYAKMSVLSLAGSWTRAIGADGLKLEGSLLLRKGFHAEGEVRLANATVGGDLDATGGTFNNPNGCALNANRVKVRGSIVLKQELNAKGDEILNAFTAAGEVRLVGATIEGDLDAEGGTFKNPSGMALIADRIEVHDVFLRNGFSAEGTVRLPGATIGGNLDAEKGTFKQPRGDALFADAIRVAGDIFISNGFSAEGEVRLRGAVVGGNLEASGGTFKNPGGSSLSADGIKVSGDIFLKNRFTAVGFISNRFSAEGEVRLRGAVVGGNLEANGGTFKNPCGSSLSADGVKVSGDIFLKNRVTAAGKVRLPGAEIAGQLEVDNAWLDELNLDSAHITGPFSWQKIQTSTVSQFPNKEWKPSLNLTDAKVGSLIDEAVSWPDKGRLRLDGFVYDRITEGPTDAISRLRWLRLQPDRLGFRPQPYEQLVTVLRRMGHEHQVAKVAIAKQKDLRKRGDLGWLGWIQSWFLYVAVGYGYRAWLAFVWLTLLIVLGGHVFSRAHAANVLVPSDQAAYEKYENPKKRELPLVYPRFHALLYSLDVVSPFDLGQKSHWRLIESVSYWRYEFYSLFQLFVGWVLLLVAAAVPAGLIKKD
jgi:predicted acyltransferase (DUF342 family)